VDLVQQIKNKIMKTNEIKKLIYKKNPTAELDMIRGGNLYYLTSFEVGMIDKTVVNQIIAFEVPISDIGATDFFPTMPAKHLLRWIVNNEV